MFENAFQAVELPHLPALGERRAGARRREESGNAGAAGPDPLDEAALRHQLQIDLAGEPSLFEDRRSLLPAPGGATDHPRHPAFREEAGRMILDDPHAVDEDRQIAGIARFQGPDEGDRKAGAGEAADHDAGAVVEAVERGLHRLDALVDHPPPLPL